MRASAHKSARRNLASSKRSIVMVCAGIAMILGATNVGASMFSNNDDVLQHEQSISNTFSDRGSISDEEAAASIINNSALRTLQGQQITVSRQPSKSPGITLKSPDGSSTITLNPNKAPLGAAMPVAIIDQIQPSKNEDSTVVNPTTNPTGGDTSDGGTTSGDSQPSTPPAGSEPADTAGGNQPDGTAPPTPPAQNNNGLENLITPSTSPDEQPAP